MISFTIFKLLIFCGLLIFLSYFFIFKVIKKLLERKRIKNEGEPVQATVIDYKISRDSAGAIRYYPFLQYTTKKGNTLIVELKKERQRRYETDKKLTLYYLPDEPSKFFISGLVPYKKIASILLASLSAILLLYEIIKTCRRL